MSRIGNFGEGENFNDFDEVGSRNELNDSPEELSGDKLDTSNIHWDDLDNTESGDNKDDLSQEDKGDKLDTSNINWDDLSDGQREKLSDLEEGKNNYLDSNSNIMDNIVGNDDLSNEDKIERLKNLRADTENFGREYDDTRNGILNDDSEDDPTKKLVLKR